MPRKLTDEEAAVSRAFGCGVQRVRWNADISQSALARATNMCPSTICYIENGSRGIALSHAVSIARALGRTVDDLILIGSSSTNQPHKEGGRIFEARK